MSDSIVIIPTYNEKENLEKMVRKVFSLEKDFHVLIVDDGSPDGTGAIVKKLQAELDRAKGFIKGIEKKLQNERFVSNAPESVLQKERDKLESQTQKISNLESSLAELN